MSKNVLRTKRLRFGLEKSDRATETSENSGSQSEARVSPGI